MGASLFASKGVIIKLAYSAGLTTEALLTLRLAISAPVYVAIGLAAAWRGRAFPAPAVALKAAAVGALGYWFASYTDFLGLNYISVQFERLILFTYPGFVVLFGALFFRQPIRRIALVGMAISYAGLLLMFGDKLQAFGPEVAKGALLVLSAAMAFAFYQLLAKGLIGRLGPGMFTCIAMMGATFVTLCQFALTQPVESLALGREALGYALLLAVGATIVPSFVLNMALARISPQANGVIGALSPVVTLVLAVLILREPITAVDILATALVLAGVGWFTLADLKPRPPAR